MRVDPRLLDKALRLTYGEEFDEIVTPPHIAKAIRDCSAINNSTTKKAWAKLHIIPSPSGAIVNLKTGPIHSDGWLETATATWTYTMDKEGMINVYCHTHHG